MTRFAITMQLTCPSGWTAEDCRAYLHRILTLQEEKDSLKILDVCDIVCDCDDEDHPSA